MIPPAQPLDLLVVAPHPDDAEIGVGGILRVCQSAGMRCGVIDLTSGEPTPHGSVSIRKTETEAATKVLQLSWRENLGLPNRSLQADLESRRALAIVFRLTRPKIILAPYWEDAHPDHVVASQLADDARFWSKLTKSDIPGDAYWPPRMLYFFSLHLRIHPKPACVIDISPHIEDKLAAVRCYESQLVTGRPQTPPTVFDDLRDRARYWGWTIGVSYAEPLASRDEIGLRDLRAIV